MVWRQRTSCRDRARCGI